MYDRTRKERRTSVVNWHNSKTKRRYRQIGRLRYRYCCVKFMKWINGRWVKHDLSDV